MLRLTPFLLFLLTLLSACAPAGTVASNFDILFGRQDWSVSGTDSSTFDLRSAVYADGLTRPTDIAHAPDGSGRLFVVQQDGQIAVLADGEVSAGPFLNLSGRVSCCGEQGLLSLAFHPEFRSSRLLYVTYTDADGALVLAEFETDVARTRTLLDSERILFRLEQPGPQHNGGDLAFGPDGTLYLSTGEGRFYETALGKSPAQDETALYGKLLAFDVSAPEPTPRIIASGLRNPWRFSIDRASQTLFVADVGHNSFEEVTALPLDGAGHNLGWPVFEGPECRAESCDETLYTQPSFSYSHDEGCSITGGAVYRGNALPDLQGAYLYGDFCLGKIWAAAETSQGWQTTLLLETSKNISSFGADERGELYFSDFGTGSVYRLEPKEQSASR